MKSKNSESACNLFKMKEETKVEYKKPEVKSGKALSHQCN